MGYIFKKVAAYGQCVLVSCRPIFSPVGHPPSHNMFYNIYPAIKKRKKRQIKTPK